MTHVFLEHPHIPGVSFHHPVHTRSHSLLTLLRLSAHSVQVKQEAYHKITSQYHAAGIFHIVKGGGTGNSLVLVQQVTYGKLQFPVLILEQLLAETRIPHRYCLL